MVPDEVHVVLLDATPGAADTPTDAEEIGAFWSSNLMLRSRYERKRGTTVVGGSHEFF